MEAGHASREKMGINFGTENTTILQNINIVAIL